MTALTELEEDEHRLRELRIDELSDLGLATVAIGLALVATFVHAPLAFPLFVGAVGCLLLGARAFFRRLDLVDALLLDSDTYVIAEIRTNAERLASMDNRRALANAARSRMTPVPGYQLSPRVAAVSNELHALAGELEDEQLTLDPECAARCRQLLSDYARSPLLNDGLPPEQAAAWIRRIRAGFKGATAELA